MGLPGLKKRGWEGLLWRNEKEGMGPGERGVRVLQGGRRRSCRGWVLGVSGRRGGDGARHRGGQRAGRRVRGEGRAGAHLCPPAPR